MVQIHFLRSSDPSFYLKGYTGSHDGNIVLHHSSTINKGYYCQRQPEAFAWCVLTQQLIYIITSAKQVMLLLVSVCWSVCRITQKLQNELPQNLGRGQFLTQNRPIHRTG